MPALAATPAAPVVRPVAATQPVPSSRYFRMAYYYPAASRGTSYYDLDESPAGRLTPLPGPPKLLPPPSMGAKSP